MKQINQKSLAGWIIDSTLAAGDRKILFGRKPDGEWIGVSGTAHKRNVMAVVAKFIESKLVVGDQIVIMAMNSYAWQVVEHAALLTGLEIIGIETHAQKDYVRDVLKVINPKVVVYYDLSHLETLKECGLQEDTLAISMQTIKDIMSANADVSSVQLPKTHPGTSATLIFTSGTTGAPKGIRYTHGDLAITIQSILDTNSDITSKDRTLSWLPMANLFQRVLNLCAIARGVEVYYATIPQNVMNLAKEVRPTFLISVPRFFEKIYKKLQEKTVWLPVALRGVALKALGLLLKRQLGGQVRYFISGSAKCQPRILEYFDSIHMPIFEAYGMSESVVPIAINTLSANRMGSVGRPLKCNTVRIGKDGEIQIKTPTIAENYLNNDKKLINEEGYLSTGDKGYIDADGYLFIEGRLNDLVKTSTGRKLNLNEIDQKFLELPYGEQAVALAENLPAVYLVLAGVSGSSDKRKQIEKEIERINSTLPTYAQVRHVLYREKPLSIEDGTLTNNLKVKRKVVASLFENEIRSLM